MDPGISSIHFRDKQSQSKNRIHRQGISSRRPSRRRKTASSHLSHSKAKHLQQEVLSKITHNIGMLPPAFKFHANRIGGENEKREKPTAAASSQQTDFGPFPHQLPNRQQADSTRQISPKGSSSQPRVFSKNTLQRSSTAKKMIQRTDEFQHWNQHVKIKKGRMDSKEPPQESQNSVGIKSIVQRTTAVGFPCKQPSEATITTQRRQIKIE
ncbi:hypothetical protein Nepgr_009394 [Nepenthes gracilis]|uniref:Uncharacterized protein n=1 Tax=Nepenthes gracilis TaxID=150966 RepID=A0AAD3SBD6_NEPGR|nr:hypothetical protein Nepgr_009394 [Nepenthes gracilis]